jgi:hypothetical protein
MEANTWPYQIRLNSRYRNDSSARNASSALIGCRKGGRSRRRQFLQSALVLFFRPTDSVGDLQAERSTMSCCQSLRATPKLTRSKDETSSWPGSVKQSKWHWPQTSKLISYLLESIADNLPELRNQAFTSAESPPKFVRSIGVSFAKQCPYHYT